jgi:hypothetical protein
MSTLSSKVEKFKADAEKHLPAVRISDITRRPPAPPLATHPLPSPTLPIPLSLGIWF